MPAAKQSMSNAGKFSVQWIRDLLGMGKAPSRPVPRSPANPKQIALILAELDKRQEAINRGIIWDSRGNPGSAKSKIKPVLMSLNKVRSWLKKQNDELTDAMKVELIKWTSLLDYIESNVPKLQAAVVKGKPEQELRALKAEYDAEVKEFLEFLSDTLATEREYLKQYAILAKRSA